MPRWLVIGIATLAVVVIAPFVLFGIGDQESDEPAPHAARVIDELRGTYRGVGLGDSARDIRRVFGRGQEGGDGPFMPLGARNFVEVGGAMFIRTPGFPSTPRTPRLLRYQDVSFLLVDDKVYALMIGEARAATQEGLAVGDDIDAVGERYDDLNCDVTEVGDFGDELPYCAGKLAPGRHIWFGQDPIRSITLATTGFGSYECPREVRLEYVRKRRPIPIGCR
jgi:hypothetical protein